MDRTTPRRDFLSRHVALWNEFLQSLQTSNHNAPKTATGYLIVAILANHIRRVLTPWLGQFLWYHAIEDMKFARSSPHYFLKASMGGDISLCWTVGTWACQWYAIELVRRVVRRRVLAVEEKARGGKRAMERMVVDVYRVAYLAILLASAERWYVETCWVGGQVYSYARLVFGSGAEKLFLRTLLGERWPWTVLLQWGLIVRWVYAAAVPKAVVVVLLYAVLWGVTVHLVRYSNKYFMVLLMSDMLVTFAWVGLAGLGYVVVRIRTWRLRIKN